MINPGLDHGDGRITVVGEHTDGTHAELIAVPPSRSTASRTRSASKTAAAFPLVFETAYRMLATKAQLREDEWVLVWGIGSGVSTACLAIAKALGARVVATSSSDDKLERARELGADATLNHDTDDVPRAVKELTGGGRTSSSSTSARQRGSAHSTPPARPAGSACAALRRARIHRRTSTASGGSS